MTGVTLNRSRLSARRFSASLRRSSHKRRPLLERLEDRVALSGLQSGPYSISRGHDASHARSVNASAETHSTGPADLTRIHAQQASLYAGPATYYTPVGTPFTTTTANGLINAVTNNGVPNVYINVIPTSQTEGTLQFNTYPPNTYGIFTYTPPSTTFTGQDTFSYQATNGTVSSNVGNVTVYVGTRATLVPTTPYFNYLRNRRSIDPARFDYYHPRIGALLGMEAAGIPSTPTTIVAVNKHFNATAARSLHARNPQQYDQKQPVLGALFQLEAPAANGHESMLPQTTYYKEQRVLYDSHPTRYSVKHVYLGAIFAIENFEQMD